MRIASSAHTAQPWLIHEITPDFRLEDVWALPTPGGPDDFRALLSAVEGDSFEHEGPAAARMLWWLRWRLGALLGIDRRASGLGARVHTLRDRLPAELREKAPAGQNDGTPFSLVYQVHNERASEIANRTVHAVLHLGWVSDGAGSWHGQMAILVKPKGALGSAYMVLIKPFRKLIIYPAILRSIEQRWQDRLGDGTDPSAAA